MRKIGFIGLGLMGRPMALNLLKAGYPLTVYDRNEHKVAALVEAGAQGAKTPREVAEAAEVIVTMLPTRPMSGKLFLAKTAFTRRCAPASISWT